MKSTHVVIWRLLLVRLRKRWVIRNIYRDIVFVLNHVNSVLAEVFGGKETLKLAIYVLLHLYSNKLMHYVNWTNLMVN